jgi:phosphomannomutase
MRHTFSPEILKACDIRGIWDTQLDETDGYYIGKAFATILSKEGKSTSIVGYDGRVTSPQFSNSVIKGLIECGIDVVNIGLVTTPMLYFALHSLKKESGIMVTASHNPKEYNGCKFVLSDQIFHEDKIVQLGEISDRGDFVTSSREGTVESIDIYLTYRNYILSFLEPTKGELAIIFDCGNGSSGPIVRDFSNTVNDGIYIICEEVDGNFPNHHPDPSKAKNMRMLADAVLDKRGDVGIAFDGDGDRLGLVDDKGRILTGDQTFTLIARDFLSTHPGETVMSEVKMSSLFYKEVEKCGGKSLMWKVGHAFQKEKMMKEGILLAGETSGHIFFAENRGFDDALFAAVKVINMLTNTTLTLSEMVDSLVSVYHTGEIRIALPTKERYQLIEDIKGRLTNEGIDFNELDGIRVTTTEGFWLLRASNTQPHLTIYCEGVSEEALKSCKDQMVAQVEASGYIFANLVV